MPFKLSRTMKGNITDGVDSSILQYEDRFRAAVDDATEKEDGHQKTFNNLYYDLVTDFYEYGWGRSFHFAPRVPGESFKESLTRHEHRIAQALELQPGMVVADIGSGIGGSLIEIARFSGASIVGVNSNAYQIERARRYTAEAGLAHLVDFIESDFLHVDAPDASFDAVYSIEATCCAPDKESIYAEIFRLLKPGGRFAAYEFIMTDRYNPDDAYHRRLKGDIMLGGGLVIIDSPETIDNALRAVGFEVLETRDLAVQTGPSIPWYQPLTGSGISFAGFRSSRVGRMLTSFTLRAMETLRVAPRGTVRVAETLNLCADGMAAAGRLGLFSPMYFIHARKPE